MFLIVGIAVVLSTNHGDTVLWMNDIHTGFLNSFFKIWTFGGDGILYGMVALALLVFKRRYGYVFLVAGLAQGVIALLMKKVLFKGTPRPRKFFEGQHVLDLIEGVRIHDFNSFPSGHTMSAFVVATFLAMMVEKGMVKFGLLIFAVLVGISRIYLNQHFLIDAVVGSFLGLVISTACHRSFRNYLGVNKR
ncbi:MAG: phosphatase PAP2 family protein [Bacteroidota bacterium]